jgi:hypothetical protein
VQKSVHLLHPLWQGVLNMHSTCCMNVLTSAKPVLKNAKSMQAWEWSIAEGVQKLAGLVPKPAIQEWQRKSNKDAEYSASFLSLSNILSNHKN